MRFNFFKWEIALSATFYDSSNTRRFIRFSRKYNNNNINEKVLKFYQNNDFIMSLFAFSKGVFHKIYI